MTAAIAGLILGIFGLAAILALIVPDNTPVVPEADAGKQAKNIADYARKVGCAPKDAFGHFMNRSGVHLLDDNELQKLIERLSLEIETQAKKQNCHPDDTPAALLLSWTILYYGQRRG